MLDAVAAALERDAASRAQQGGLDDLRALYETLSVREKQVMALVASDLMNKQATHQLGLSEITVKIHRGNLMRKMEARSLADLARMAETLKLRPEDPS